MWFCQLAILTAASATRKNISLTKPDWDDLCLRLCKHKLARVASTQASRLNSRQYSQSLTAKVNRGVATDLIQLKRASTNPQTLGSLI